jgi:hypothetical protein
LHAGTHQQNMIEASQRRRFPMQHRTHCPSGHPYTPQNTGINQGARRCKACAREYARRKRVSC